jgi:hypothetical protein
MKTKALVNYYMRLESGKLLKVHQEDVIFETQEELVNITDVTCNEISSKYGNKVIRSFDKYSKVDEGTSEGAIEGAIDVVEEENLTQILTEEETGVILDDIENKTKNKPKRNKNDQI